MNLLLRSFLRKAIHRGDLTIVDAAGSAETFGDGTGERFRVRMHDRAVPLAVMLDPELAIGETYLDGRWSLVEGSLAGFLTLLMECQRSADPSGPMRLVRRATRAIAQRNTLSSARRNARAHYDVGNDVYGLFLDEDWQYSCAYFAEPDASLEAAQLAKKRHIAAKLRLALGQRVLDIGCGWGGMALYLNEVAGVDATGITLADNQLALARERAGGRPGVRFHLADYRAVHDRYDRIVSVGMFEHVGAPYYDEFFRAVRRLLADDGVALVHSIGRFGRPGATNPFIAKYIFPGGYIPALSEVLPAVERAGLFVTDVEILRLHYAETLKAWRERFGANRARIEALRGERFVRMFEFYLAGSEAAFRAGDMMVFQMQLTRSQTAVPLTRDYMGEAERALAAREAGRGPRLVRRG